MSNENNAPAAGVTHTKDCVSGECTAIEKNEKVDEENWAKDCVNEGNKTIFSSSREKLDTSTLQTSTGDNDYATTNLEGGVHGENVDYSTETSDSNSLKGPKTLLQRSLENLANNTETSQGKDNSQDTCSPRDTVSESEVRDVGDILAMIDTTPDKQASMSNIEEGLEERLENNGESYLVSEAVKTEDIFVVNERNEMSDNSCDCQETSLDQRTNESTNKKDAPETEKSSCLLPHDNSMANDEHLNTVESNSLPEKEGLVSGTGEEPAITSYFKDETKNDVFDRHSTEEKTSKVRYIASSDTAMEASNKIDSSIRDGSNSACAEMEKPGGITGFNLGQLTPVTEQDTGVKLVQPQSVTGPEIRSKLGQPVPGKNINSNPEPPGKIQDVSSENDNARITNRLGNSPDETTSLLESQKGLHCDGAVNEPEFNHANRSPLEISSGSSVAITFSDSTDGRHGKNSSSRNTAEVNSKKVSNSVFYDDCKTRENSSDHVFDGELVSNFNSDTVRLSSNTSTNSVSCFCGGNIKKTSSPYKPASESDSSNLV